MNAQTDKRKARAPFHGVGQIFRFNWPRYVAAGGLVFAVLLALSFSHAAGWIRICGIMAISFAVWWTMASLIASYWVYDCSKLMEWDWVKGEPRAPVNRWLNIHAGLDESTKSLSEFWPNAEGETVDIFAPAEMTEDSIRRARNKPENCSRPADYRSLPFGANRFDTVFLFFAAHELRHREARRALFTEVRRVLKRNGRAVLVEHLRDFMNFAVYGHGVLHFHSRRTWHRDTAAGGLDIEREFSFTPFVRVFILRNSP